MPGMTLQEATDRLALLVASVEEPILSPANLADLLVLSKRVDEKGLLPTEVGWVPTFDLNAAACEGWRRKAGLASAGYNFTASGKAFARSDIVKHCLDMSKEYAKKSGLSSIQIDRGEEPVPGFPFPGVESNWDLNQVDGY